MSDTEQFQIFLFFKSKVFKPFFAYKNLMVLLIPLLFILSSWIPMLSLTAVSQIIHNQCLDLISFDSYWKNIYEALICGKKLPVGYLKEIFLKGGLIHLMVISGAHLLFLEKFWKILPLPYKIKKLSLYLILILYTLGASLYPPVTRALFAFCLFRFSESKKLFLSSTFVTHLSGFLCLIYNPSWVHSSSLQLSWLASLSQNTKTSLKKCILTYFIILPIINRWQELHYLTIIINWLISPLIGAILFPLSFLSVLFHPLHFLTDKLWNIIFDILQIVKFFPPSISFLNFSVPKNWTWLYISFTLLIFYIINSYKRFSLYKKGT